MSAGLNPSMSSIQFDTNPASNMVGKMRSVDTGFQDGAAPAAQTQPPSVLPLTKDTISSRGRATAWRNPVAGGSTFMSWDDNNGGTPPPQSIGV
jgi:hypothetical protein